MYLLNRNMMLSQVTNFLKKNKKIMYYLGFFAVMYLGTSNTTFAAEGNTDFAEGFNAFIQIISVGIWMIWNLIWVFLNPSWTNATGIGLSGILKDLWIMVSNIIYFIFAILLVVIAFMNIIGKDGIWELKQALPKFVIWVLIVPFSWFFVQIIISFSSVLSASVLSLPYDTFYQTKSNNWSSFEEIMKQPICTTYVHIQATGSWWSATKAQNWCWEKKKTVKTMLQWEGGYGLLSVYTYWIFSVDQVTSLTDRDIDSFKSLFSLTINTLLVLVLFVIYFILMVSLWLALFTRWIWLWLYMIFSPVFGLLYFFWKEKDGFMEWKFSVSEFIWLAMVPVYVSAALSFGLLFIFVAWQSFKVWDTNNGTAFLKYKPLEAGKSYPNDAKLTSKTGWTRITFLNEYHMDMYGGMWTSTETGLDALDVMKSWVWTLIIQMFWLAILWIAVMAALNQSKITWAVVEPIASFGKQVGGLITKSPQYAPIFGGQSMQSMKQISWAAETSMRNTATDKSGEFMKKHELFGQSAVLTSESKKANDAIKAQGITKNTLENFKSAFDAWKSWDDLRSNNEFIKLLKSVATAAKMPESDLKEIKPGMWLKKLNDIIFDLDYELSRTGNKTWAVVDLISGQHKERNSTTASDIDKYKANKLEKTDDRIDAKDINLTITKNWNIWNRGEIVRDKENATKVDEWALDYIVAEIKRDLKDLEWKITDDDLIKGLEKAGITNDKDIQLIFGKLWKDFFKKPEKKVKTDTNIDEETTS